MDKTRILLADDDITFCYLVKDLLMQNNYEVIAALNSEEAQNILQMQSFDIMMLDLCFPALGDGFNLLDYVKTHYPKIIILMISGSGNITDVVRAIKNGATDFIEKPIEPEHLLVRINNLNENLKREKQVKQLEYTAINMIGISQVMNNVFESIITASKYDRPVLITGETGVGKELAAQAIHRLSKLGLKDMVCLNCASIPKELFEAQLFGYEKGSFTGATDSFKGFFALAQDTTLFLDEISELPLGVQSKLLRVLSEGEVQHIGGKIGKTNSRIISATNKDLSKFIEDGNFREDLLYRLNTIQIYIPPLREHKEDIIPLAKHFADLFCQKNHIPPKEISNNALTWLTEQEWKGNIRELKNCIERAIIFSQKRILEQEDLLCLPITETDYKEQSQNLHDSVKKYETSLIKQYLEANDYNITRTAIQLGVDKSNLSKRIHALGIYIPK